MRLTAAYHRAIQDQTEWLRIWTVQPCSCLLCRSGAFVAVDEPSSVWEGLRHMQVSNLQNLDELEHELAAE